MWYGVESQATQKAVHLLFSRLRDHCKLVRAIQLNKRIIHCICVILKFVRLAARHHNAYQQVQNHQPPTNLNLVSYICIFLYARVCLTNIQVEIIRDRKFVL